MSNDLDPERIHKLHVYDRQTKQLLESSEDPNPYEEFDPEKVFKKSWKLRAREWWDRFFYDPARERAKATSIASEVQLLDQLLEDPTVDPQQGFRNFIIRRPSHLFPNPFDTEKERSEKFYALMKSYRRQEVPCFSYATLFNSARAGMSAYYITNRFRKVTGLYKNKLGHAFTMMPSVGMSSLFLAIGYHQLYEKKLVTGQVECPICFCASSALYSGFFGGVYPVMVSSITTFYLANKYDTMLLPDEYLTTKHGLQYYWTAWKKAIKPYRSRFFAIFMVNAIVGYFGSLCQMYHYYFMYSELSKKIDQEAPLPPDSTPKKKRPGTGYTIEIPEYPPMEGKTTALTDIKDFVLRIIGK